MKKSIAIALVSLLVLSGCADSADTPSASQEQTTSAETNTTEVKSEQKWDLLMEGEGMQFKDTNLYHRYPNYDWTDLFGYIYVGKEQGEKNKSVILMNAHITTTEEFQVSSLDEVKSKFLVRENDEIGSSLDDVLKSQHFEWKVTSEEKLTINGMEFLHLTADVEGYLTDDKRYPKLYNKLDQYYKDGGTGHVEGYFTLVDKVDGSGKELFALMRGWNSDSSEDVKERTEKVVGQLLESLYIKK